MALKALLNQVQTATSKEGNRNSKTENPAEAGFSIKRKVV